MREIIDFAWKRFGLLTATVGDLQGRFIITAFYFTVVVPFGIGSRIFSDPLKRKDAPQWQNRELVPDDLESAQQQG